MTTAAPPAEATNVDRVRWAFEILNGRDVTPLKQFWTEETVVRFPDRECRGADAIASYFGEVFAALPDFHMDVVSIAGSGDDVYVQWKLTATHTGAAFQGIDAGGKSLALDGMDHFVLRDGRVVSNFVVYDQMQFARQIGLMPADGSPGDRALKTAFNLRLRLAERLRG